MQAIARVTADNISNLPRHIFGLTEEQPITAVLQKRRVQWLIEHSTSHQILWYVDSLVLRNPPFAKPQNVYVLNLFVNLEANALQKMEDS